LAAPATEYRLRACLASSQPYPFAEADGWAAVRVPYVGGELAAELILPPAGTAPSAISTDTLAKLHQALAASTSEPVELWLPTLDLAPKPLDLRGVLGDRAPSVLCGAPNTDLSGIGPQDLCVSQAVQQAVLQLDEEGTKAAAVTEIGAVASGAPAQPEHKLHLDRPFLLQISASSTGWPLFLAAVTDPRH